jgi:site-specific DNA-methyltransferase (adenine-specific)
MPNTFSMSPEYVRKFVRRHKLRQPPVDVFAKLRERVQWLLRAAALPGRGLRRVVQGDATKLPRVLADAGVAKVDAIVTSPPYLGVLRYGAFNWIRLWFLGHGPAAVDRMLDGTDSLDRYLSFLVSFLHSAAEVLPVGGPVALVIGDVKEFGTHLRLGERVWTEMRGLVPFKLVALTEDKFDQTVKTTRIWGENRKGRATPLDRILVLERAPLKRRRRGTRSKVEAAR